MIRRALIVLALCGAGFRAEAAVPPAAAGVEPSAAALSLARSTGIGPLGLTSRLSPEQAAAALSNRLLHTVEASRGARCDPQVPECRAAADRIAHEAAPALIAERREAAARMVAVIFDDSMTPEEMRAAAAFAATPAGRSFARAVSLAADPGAAPPALQQRLMVALARPGMGDGRLLERFYDETKQLPRARLVAPPPPMPSPPRKP